MIDWVAKIIQLKAMADEMDMWHSKTDGQLKTMLGRNTDELRIFIHQLEAEMTPSEHNALAEPPEWVTEPETHHPGEDVDS